MVDCSASTGFSLSFFKEKANFSQSASKARSEWTFEAVNFSRMVALDGRRVCRAGELRAGWTYPAAPGRNTQRPEILQNGNRVRTRC